MAAVSTITRRTWPRTSTAWIVPAGLLGICVFLVVGSLDSALFAQQTISGLANGGIYASLAVALVLIYRATEVINFAQGAMAMFTTYIAFQLMQWGLSYWPAFVLTLVVAFVGGFATEREALEVLFDTLSASRLMEPSPCR